MTKDTQEDWWCAGLAGQGDQECSRRMISAVSLWGMLRRTGVVQGWPDQGTMVQEGSRRMSQLSPCVTTCVSMTGHWPDWK